MKFDNRYLHETAEGIALYVTPAGIGVRSFAYAIDMLIRGVIITVASIIFGLLGDFGIGILLLTVFIVEWFYPVLFEIYKGATPGKRQFNLTVVYDNGLPITLPGSMIRNLFRAIDILPFGYALGAVTMLNNKRFKRLGDILGGTMVVYNKENKVLSNQLEFVEPLSVTKSLTLEQKMAIVEFTERSNSLSDGRKQELAEILLPLLDCSPEEAVTKLQSIGANLMGTK